MTKRKNTKDFIACFLAMMCIYSCTWGAGSYPFSEVYLLNISSVQELIDSINVMKQKDDFLNIYCTNENGDTISMDCISYSFYMSHFKIDSIGYKCAIHLNQTGEKMVAIRFVSIAIGKGIEKNDWKEINTQELSKKDDEKYKEIFEEKVLNRLGIQWRRYPLSDYYNN